MHLYTNWVRNFISQLFIACNMFERFRKSVRLKKPRCQRRLKWRAEKGWWLLPPDIPEGAWQTEPLTSTSPWSWTWCSHSEGAAAAWVHPGAWAEPGHRRAPSTSRRRRAPGPAPDLLQDRGTRQTQRQEVEPSPGKDAHSRKHTTCSCLTHHSPCSSQCKRSTVSHHGSGWWDFWINKYWNLLYYCKQ